MDSLTLHSRYGSIRIDSRTPFHAQSTISPSQLQEINSACLRTREEKKPSSKKGTQHKQFTSFLCSISCCTTSFD